MTDGSDDIADAPSAALNTVTDGFSNTGYTVESGEPPSPADDPLSEWFGASWAFQRTAWWTHVGTGVATQVHAQRSFYTPPVSYDPDILVSVYSGSPGSLTLVARGSLADEGFDGTGYAGVGNTDNWSPWVANWNAESGVTYYIQLASIYDEDISYRLTVVPTPATLLGDWLDGDPVEIDTTDTGHFQSHVSNVSSGGALVVGDAVDGAWSGTGTVTEGTAYSSDTRGSLATFLPDPVPIGDGVTYGASWEVAWMGVLHAWPSSPSYPETVPVDEPAEPAHDSVEWGTLSGPGVSRRLVVQLATDYASSGSAPNGYLKLGGYNLIDPDTSTNYPVYNPGFKTRSEMLGLSTLGVGDPSTEVSVSIPTDTDSVGFALVDSNTVAGSYGSPDWQAYIYFSAAHIYSTAVPQYRYTYTDVPVTGAVAVGKRPMRRYPREDGYGIGPTRHWPPPKSRRGVGGYH